VRAPDSAYAFRARARAPLAVIVFGLLFANLSGAIDTPTSALVGQASAHVSYFAEGIDIPFETMAEIVKGIRECSRRFPDCKSKLAKEGGDSMDAMDTLIDLGPLFASSLARAPTPEMNSTTEGLVNLAALDARLATEVRNFDRIFVVRYGAVLHACMDDDREQMGMLGSMLRIDMNQFEQGTQGDFERESPEMVAQIKDRAASLKQQWSAETCKSALALGQAMSRAYWHKVKPYAGDDWQRVTENRFRLAFGSIWEMAYALAVEHDPAVSTRIDEYYRLKEAARKD